ncbi:MAG TPA: porin [Leucothrix sp.]|nr:porin [Leucothrix sp.]
MKKLLAIAVAAAITVPMVAMADTTVYGKGHMSIGKTEDISGMFVESHSSRIGLKGSNALDNGLTATHQFELGYNLIDEEGTISARNSWIGLKGGFGEFRIGRQTTPYSIVDDAAAFTTRNDHALHTFDRIPNALAYINKFGSVGFALAYVAAGEAEGGSGSDSITNLLVNYSAGPLYAGVALQDVPTGDTGTKFALAYKGANYGVGYAFEKHPGSGVKSNTIAGKYSFGKAYLAAQYGKNSGGTPEDETKQKTFELGYSLGKGTKTYYEWEDIGGKKSNRVGLSHSF